MGLLSRHKLRKVAAAGIAVAMTLSSAKSSAQSASAPQAQVQSSLSKKEQTKELVREYKDKASYLEKNLRKVELTIARSGMVVININAATLKFLSEYIEMLESLSKTVNEIEKLRILPEKIIIKLHAVVVEYTNAVDKNLFNASIRIVRWSDRIVTAEKTVEEKRKILQKSLALSRILYQMVLRSDISFPLSTIELLKAIEILEADLKRI